MSDILPKHSLQRRDLLNYNGTVHNSGIFIRSGSIDDLPIHTTGSVTLTFDARGLKLKRIEMFHSGTATTFAVSLENSAPNTGSFYDPRSLITCYDKIPGADDWSSGIDQIEDMYCITDQAASSKGKLYLKIVPNPGSTLDSFKYLLFFEAVFLYVNKDGTLNS